MFVCVVPCFGSFKDSALANPIPSFSIAFAKQIFLNQQSFFSKQYMLCVRQRNDLLQLGHSVIIIESVVVYILPINDIIADLPQPR